MKRKLQIAATILLYLAVKEDRDEIRGPQYLVLVGGWKLGHRVLLWEVYHDAEHVSLAEAAVKVVLPSGLMKHCALPEDIGVWHYYFSPSFLTVMV